MATESQTAPTLGFPMVWDQAEDRLERAKPHLLTRETMQCLK